MAAAEEPVPPFMPRESGMRIDFKEGIIRGAIITFTELEPDAFKLTFHQLLRDGTTHDLLFRNTTDKYPPVNGNPYYHEPCMIEQKISHIERKTAEEIWRSFNSGFEFMNSPESTTNEKGQRVSKLTVRSHNSVVGAIHYLDSIAWAIYAQEKREAAAAQKDAKKAARAASAAESKERMEALKSTPEYKEQMEMERFEQQRLDDEAAAAAEAKRAERDAPPTGPRRAKGGPKGGTRRPSRKYKKSKRVLRRKSRSTRRR